MSTMSPEPHMALKPIAPAYAVCGTETFLKRRAIAEIRDRVLSPADRSLALTEYDGASGAVTLAEVLDDLRTLPFLTEHRLVVVREADTFITSYRQDLEAYVEKPSPTGVLLLECRSLPANTRLYKRIAAIGEVVKCDPLKAYQVPQWVVRRCTEAYGQQLDAQAAAMLCDLVGTDLGLLDAELTKLSIYTAPRVRIETKDVQALVGACREEAIWGVMSAVLEGDVRKALLVWEDVWETDRAASARAIAGLAYKVRQLLGAKRAQQAGAPLNELEQMMMVFRNPRRLQAELAAFSTDQVEQMLGRLLEADLAAKTGGAAVRSSVEAFIVEFGQRRSGRAIA